MESGWTWCYDDLPPGEADVVVVVHPTTYLASREEPPYRSDYGVWRDKLPDVDVDDELREMNRLWEKGIDLPA